MHCAKCGNIFAVSENPIQVTVNGKPLHLCDGCKQNLFSIRKGKLIDGRYPNENKCSACGQIFRDEIQLIIQDNNGEFQDPKYCPSCGARWDIGSKANGCWIDCKDCASKYCSRRDEDFIERIVKEVEDDDG